MGRIRTAEDPRPRSHSLSEKEVHKLCLDVRPRADHLWPLPIKALTREPKFLLASGISHLED